MSQPTHDAVLDAIVQLPLFAGLARPHLAKLVDALVERELPAGAVLFTQGDEAQTFYVLLQGEIKLISEGREIFRLSPIQLIGELGALTHITRNTTAVLATDCSIASIDGDKLRSVLMSESSVGLPVYQNLVDILTTKMMRDRDTTEEIRRNLIHTQKEMKRVRDLILEQPETPLSEPIYNVLEDLVSNNRRANYRIKPTEHLPAHVVFGSLELPVVDMSVKGVALKVNGQGDLPRVGERVSGVLHAAGLELPVSGDVARRETDVLAITLDLMIDEYEAQLTDYLVRVQMLSFVV